MNKILHANMDDAEEILALQKIAYQSEAEIYNDWAIPPLTQTLEDIKNEFKEMIFLKIYEGNALIGSVRALLNNDICEIGRLIVHPNFQGKGLGSLLMFAIEAEFSNAKRFELFTGSKSKNNIRLYEKLGYRICRTDLLSPRVDIVYLEKVPSKCPTR
ncbi:MAG: GNAT family N-acetyltransferase [Desulfuromonas sp.]|nr:MAG: GNAT family N-acetyltransferase [Desulfuromonas sp.]